MSTKTIKVILIALAALCLTSCEQFEEVQEIVLKAVGTSNLRLYERCLNQRRSSLSLNAQKRYCSKKYEQALGVSITGSGSYDSESIEWSGTLKNTSSSVIVSRITIAVAEKKLALINDAATSVVDTYFCSEPIWLEPGEESYFSCGLLLDPYRLNNTECASDDKGDWCWEVFRSSGFTIKN